METPGKATAIILGSIGAITFAFPILCLPTSITAIVLATKGIRWERENGVSSSALLQTVRLVSALALSVTCLAMISAIPSAWERNFG